ncbi:hypothetical protein GCL60_05970 [Silvanigrella paludirubra]|uniref:Putative DNA-binding domain-containing protein n=1 Tax=Silvanigrella paludirubra TaxID=2499159 RepID=A0A6N6VZA0_9BACT|nr:DNA-binding domain-containing protein [Silvanigrella paludirubra]KAB8039808.1 hypothetical protein GCL60_05970 [Silvanigrella paludirubra]
MKNLSFKILQQQFADYLKTGANEIENVILDQLPISVFERLLVYRTAYNQRIYSSLKEDFPKIYEILNEDNFNKLVEEYRIKYPSTYWSLGEFSKNLPDFIAESNWGKEIKYMEDLAKLEWIKCLCFLAKNSDYFNFSSIALVPSEKQNKIILKLDSSVIFFESPWALHKKSIKKSISNKINYYIIYRNNGIINVECILKKDWNILQKISQGLNIEEIVEKTQVCNEKQISKCFSNWVKKGIISHFIYRGE